MVKYTKERLLKNPMIVHISDCGLEVTCKCGKVIKLKRAYDEVYFLSHINSGGCKFQDGVVSILNYFSPTLKDNQPTTKRYTCTGLDSPIYKAYINQVFTHTTHVVAQELFPKKFPPNKAVIYKKLSENDLQLLDKEIIRQSKWKIEGLVVRSVSCEQYTTNSSRLCNYCKEVQDDQVFK
ncbi:14708_t:CDS:2, partial [Racocetra fulgida]